MAEKQTDKKSSGAGKFLIGAALGAIAGAFAGKFVKLKKAKDDGCGCGDSCDCDGECDCDNEGATPEIKSAVVDEPKADKASGDGDEKKVAKTEVKKTRKVSEKEDAAKTK